MKHSALDPLNTVYLGKHYKINGVGYNNIELYCDDDKIEYNRKY